METTTQTEQFTMTVEKSKRKSGGMYHYKIFNAAGEIVSERKSNRMYAAATVNGEFFFGRPDLVGRGSHGKQLKYIEIALGYINNPNSEKPYPTPRNYKQKVTNDQWEWIHELNTKEPGYYQQYWNGLQPVHLSNPECFTTNDC